MDQILLVVIENTLIKANGEAGPAGDVNWGNEDAWFLQRIWMYVEFPL